MWVESCLTSLGCGQVASSGNAADIAVQARLRNVTCVLRQSQQIVDLSDGGRIARLSRVIPRPAAVESCAIPFERPVLLSKSHHDLASE